VLEDPDLFPDPYSMFLIENEFSNILEKELGICSFEIIELLIFYLKKLSIRKFNKFTGIFYLFGPGSRAEFFEVVLGVNSIGSWEGKGKDIGPKRTLPTLLLLISGW
jgi:hypothetical protein